jgi:hypothetical protein
MNKTLQFQKEPAQEQRSFATVLATLACTSSIRCESTEEGKDWA